MNHVLEQRRTDPSVMLLEAGDIDEYNHKVQRMFMPLTVSSSARGFSGAIRAAEVGEVRCCRIAANEHAVERTAADVASGVGGDHYKVSLMLAGTSLVVQDGREATLAAGDMALYDTGRPYTLVSSDDARTAVLMFPRGLLAVPPELVGQLAAVRFDARIGVAPMVSSFISSMARNLDQFGSEAGERLARNTIDIVTTLIVDELGLHASLDARGSMLRRVCAHIEQNLGDPTLGPGSIAAAHYVSARYLYSLFHDEGTTVSAWIRDRRLERCRRDLSDPLCADLSVSSIAARWGFIEPTHFSRVFKDKFGCTPRESRLERSAA